MGLEEDYDIDSAAFSAIEQFISTIQNSSLQTVSPFLQFDAEQPNVREVSFKILSAMIVNCDFNEKAIFSFLETILVHLNDSFDRVKEASLWALHALCYKKVLPLELVKNFFERGNVELFEALSSFFIEIESGNNSVLAAIACEILSLFAIDNVNSYFQIIFDMLFRFLSFFNSNSILNPNVAFIQMRIEKVLIKMCACTFDQQELIFHILSFFCSFLDQTLQNNSNHSEYLIEIYDFLCEIIDVFFQNNILCSFSFDVSIFNELIQNILNALQKNVSDFSISAITSIFLSIGNSFQFDMNVLFQLFESFPNESINSIIRFSINQSNYSFLLKFWTIIMDKHSSFFAPLIKQIESESVFLDESHVPVFESLYNPLFLSDFLTILEIVISNSESATKWIEFGFVILNNLQQSNKSNQDPEEEEEEFEINEIFEDNLRLIINFFQSAAASDIQLFRKLLVNFDLIYLLNYAFNFPDIASDAQLILIALNDIE